jgi:hypothetical protein
VPHFSFGSCLSHISLYGLALSISFGGGSNIQKWWTGLLVQIGRLTLRQRLEMLFNAKSYKRVSAGSFDSLMLLFLLYLLNRSSLIVTWLWGSGQRNSIVSPCHQGIFPPN